MNGILHSGAFNCSGCYSREASHERESCLRYRQMRAGAGFRRRLNVLLGEARERFRATVTAVLHAVTADTFLIANRESVSAFQASQEAFDILEQGNKIWGRLTAIDPPQAEMALPELIRALQQCTEVATRASQAWEIVIGRMALPADENNAYHDGYLPAV